VIIIIITIVIKLKKRKTKQYETKKKERKKERKERWEIKTNKPINCFVHEPHKATSILESAKKQNNNQETLVTKTNISKNIYMLENNEI
jgi:hypothetical protein